MSPGGNTAVMNSETKQTKRGRLKQEAQHRYRFLQHLDTTGGHACSFGKKIPDSHVKIQII